MLCYMCEKKRAKKLTARSDDGMIYVNAENRKVFCSKRCAANWGLLWVNINGEAHWCKHENKWVHCEEYYCDHCNPDRS